MYSKVRRLVLLQIRKTIQKVYQLENKEWQCRNKYHDIERNDRKWHGQIGRINHQLMVQNMDDLSIDGDIKEISLSEDMWSDNQLTETAKKTGKLE